MEKDNLEKWGLLNGRKKKFSFLSFAKFYDSTIYFVVDSNININIIIVVYSTREKNVCNIFLE